MAVVTSLVHTLALAFVAVAVDELRLNLFALASVLPNDFLIT
jgi:hypothetical protein